MNIRILNSIEITKNLILIFFLIGFSSAQSFEEQGRISASQTPFNNPQAISVSNDGQLYVVDTGNSLIQIFDLRGKFKRSIGGFGFQEDQFDNPTDIWTRSLINYYVSDYNNRRIQRYDRNLNFISLLENDEANDPEFQFEEVASCAVNSNNDLFILDKGENKIIKINRHGEGERSFGSYESGEGELEDPKQLDIQQGKYILVSDAASSALFVFDFFGTFIQKLTHEKMKKPAGLCVLNSGEILLTDAATKQLFKINKALSSIETIELKTTKSVKHLTDVAAWKDKDKTMLFLLDGNEVIIGFLH